MALLRDDQGASSPEMFAALIGVVDGSAVGAGTVVGSELFNMVLITPLPSAHDPSFRSRGFLGVCSW